MRRICDARRASPISPCPQFERRARCGTSVRGPGAGRAGRSATMQEMKEADAPVAFVVMPFAPDFNAVFADVIAPALGAYEVVRADSRFDERNILAKIMTGIDEAELIIADLTETNPNVMYELGVAHALGKPVVMIAESVEGLPFDIRSYPVHSYGARLTPSDTLTSILRQIASRHLEGGILFGNPVADFVRRIASSVPAGAAEAAYDVEKCLQDMNWAAEHIAIFFSEFHSLTETQDRRVAAASALIGRSGALDPTRNPGIREAAAATRDFANDLDHLASRFHEIWERYGRAMRWLLAPEQRLHVGEDGVLSYAHSAQQSSRNLDDVIGNLAEVRHALASFPDYSGNLSHAVEHSRQAISNLLNEIMTAKGYLRWVMKHDPQAT